MAMLTVNLNQVAALREVSRLREPDPAQAAVLAELAGADGIAVGLRRDRRNIRDRDLYLLREIVKTKLTVEIPPTDDIIERILEVKPSMVTFVADHTDSEAAVSGIDFNAAPIDFSEPTVRFKGLGVAVCFLVDPDPGAIRGATKAGAEAVLLNCSGFSQAKTVEEAQTELDRIDIAAQAASKAGLSVYAGRGLNYRSIPALQELNLIDEFFIGHAIVARAVMSGFDAAVKEMSRLVTGDRHNR